MNIHSHFKQMYDEAYAADLILRWREIGGKGKAKNIIEVCKNYSFENVLDVGSGDGSVLMCLDLWKFHDNITATEISETGVRQINKRKLPSVKQIVKFDGYYLPFKDTAFDLSVCSHVIEHVEHPRVLLREIGRVSKYQVFEIPKDFSFSVDKKVNHFLSYGHINIALLPSLFRFLLFSEGFKIINEKYSLYSWDVFKYVYRNQKLKLLETFIKNLMRKLLPPLMKFKPSTYTVFAQKKNAED
jgi:ubiquinone/menaquinone biosynthesis C-methylase UbiE